MSLFFRVAPRGVPRGVRNWKQACPIFSELPAWSSAWSSPQSWGDNRIEGGNPGVTTGLKEAILQLKEAILGPRSHWQKKSVLQSSHVRTGFFFWEESRPWRGLGRAPMPGRRGREARRGRHQAEPSQSPAPLLYVLYVLYGSHKASH